MHVCICIYRCINICIYIHMYTNIHIDVCIYAYIHKYIHNIWYVFKSVCVCVCTCIYINMKVFSYGCMYMYIYMYIYIYIYMYIYIYIYIYVTLWLCSNVAIAACCVHGIIIQPVWFAEVRIHTRIIHLYTYISYLHSTHPTQAYAPSQKWYCCANTQPIIYV